MIKTKDKYTKVLHFVEQIRIQKLEIVKMIDLSIIYTSTTAMHSKPLAR